MMPLYFAYGANMDVAAMAQRCPSSKPLGLARLPRHRWLISSDGYANVIRDPRRDVHGMLWELALSDVPVLDRFEDVPRLYRKVSQPVIAVAGIRRALVYVGRAVDAGRPRPGYLDDVVRAGEAIGLPGAYLRDLRKFGDVRPAIAAPATAAKQQKWVWTP
jgi:gamma-glutamylcyclotransferase (GGCT)/AIG2-like uncharacterized protein YtfP